MNSKYLVRIVKSELMHFKNVAKGENRYMNYGSVEKRAEIEKKDIVGLYGQNGSGKTAMVEALAILKCILSGQRIPYESYEGLLDSLNRTKIITVFYIEHAGDKYKARYEVSLDADSMEKKINLS